MTSSTPSSSWSTPPTPFLTSLASIPDIVFESEVEPLELSYAYSDGVDAIPTPATIPSLSSSLFFGRNAGTVPSTPAATPPPSPALFATSTNASINPSPTTTPPASPSPSFLATWHGRLPSIPRPSPMMPFRAAKKVVTSVTSVGTGLLPSKEQLGSIPVAGRILKHPVMDSTLTYIASKTMHRHGKRGGEAVTPENAYYRKLNKKLIDQSITLAALAIDKEELSKIIGDEAYDDAFELYLTAIATLMHALPIEMCDPFRRKAFESQLRIFLQDNQLEPEAGKEEIGDKQRRRYLRRRQRDRRDHADDLIYVHSAQFTGGVRAPHQPISSSSSRPTHARRSRTRRGRRKVDGSGGGGPSSLGDTIISTAVESAIRLKQSPIPDVIKTCFHTTRTVISKVDKRFHLKDKAWRLSKQSIEKAIELDEQYAIHERMTETFFATLTGLVKAGIAYNETPGYSATLEAPRVPGRVKAVVSAPAPAPAVASSCNPQTIPTKTVSLFSGKRYSIMNVDDEEYSMEKENEEEEVVEVEGDGDSHGSDGFDSDDSGQSSSCFTASEDEEGGMVDDYRDDNRHNRADNISISERIRQSLLSIAAVSIPTAYVEHAQKKPSLFNTLTDMTFLILGRNATQ
ncbi:hypothetical protein BG011_007484 [Mortierella polycephala]|uniref:Uncharacterized protein n=1 Tax=Mortierella polycephala TaxID=41804 RepID=A0A9P6QD72_9FUNG|nr:hypothetical protein BG011_007484 [Mortierella polycephala]